MTGRQAFPDELRGVALLGIVLVNAPFLLISEIGPIGSDPAAWWDTLADGLVAAFAQGKSYLLFAALFGYGAALMLRLDHGAADPVAVRRYRRRLVGLGVLGALHATLLFIGDILLPYALIGILIPWLATRSDRGLVRLAVAGWAFAALMLALLVLAVAAEPGSGALNVATTSSFDRTMTDGSVGAMIEARVKAYPGAALTLGVLNWPLVFACFCIGLMAGRRRLLAEPAAWSNGPPARAIIGLWLLIGVPCGVVAGLLQVGLLGGGATVEIGGLALSFVTAPVLSAGYVVLLARASAAGRLGWAARGGRQSLTGYLGESFALVAVAAPWGLGLYGDLGSAAVLGVAVATYALYEAFATAWSRRFRQGPLEWLLRWWTHARRPPLRRPAAATSPAGS